MDKTEWISRYAARIRAKAGWSEEEAMGAAVAGAEVFEDNERAAGNKLDWTNPEDEADEEMTCWSNDE